MFFLREPIVKATIRLLQLYGVRVNESTVNETLQNHPAWPSLLSVSDALSEWKVPNAAGKANPEDLDTIPTPFLAVINDRISPQAVVSQIRDNEVDIYKNDFDRIESIPKEDFFKKWKGIYLIGEPDENSGEERYNDVYRKRLVQTLSPFVAGVLLFCLGFFFLGSKYESVAPLFNTNVIYLQYLIYTAGLIISSLLVWYEIDKSNPILKKICTGLVKTNCDAVLNSKQSKIFNTVSWGEIGFYYYSGSLLTILFAPVGIYSIQALGWLAILALPYTVFSIYYQWKIVKEWCTLCLTVQFLLIINAIIISFSDTVLFPLEINGVTSFLILILFIIVPLLWYAIKPLAYKIQKSTNSSREYNRLKYNTEIFETLLLKQKSITAPLEGLGIDLGDPSASNLLVKVCNPYCGPCANAHPRIEELINQNTNIKAKIIFTTKNDPSHPAYNPTRHLLAIAEIGNENMTRKALDDWYLANNKEYEQFSIKFPVNGDLQRQAEKMVKMDAWCAKMEINHTPTIFVNGFQLPDAYDIEDLKYFLLD